MDHLAPAFFPYQLLTRDEQLPLCCRHKNRGREAMIFFVSIVPFCYHVPMERPGQNNFLPSVYSCFSRFSLKLQIFKPTGSKG